MTTAPEPRDQLSDDEIRAIRDAVAQAVLESPAGLRDGLERDGDAYLRLVAASRVASDEAALLLRESVSGARAAGHSWDSVGQLLGVSRQAAQQRFSSATAKEADRSNDRPDRRVLTPLTAFNEMGILAEEGRRGWHSVDYGTLYHLVEASEWQWEHKRLPWTPGGGARRRLEADGWILVRHETFPWAYYARQLDLPAEA